MPEGPDLYKSVDQKITKIREKTDFLVNQSVSAEVRDKAAYFLHHDWKEKSREEKDTIMIKCPAIPTKIDVRFRNEFLRFRSALVRFQELKTISMKSDHVYNSLAKQLLFTKGTFKIFIVFYHMT